MTSIFSQWVSKRVDEKPLEPGIYHYIAPQNSPIPYRLHLRVEPGDHSILVVNASTILHLNPTASAYALQLVQGASAEQAAVAVARRYKVSRRKARQDYDLLRQQILALATNPDVDPVLYLDLDRNIPYEQKPSAPYRMDLALTYATDPDGELDPLARARTDRELNTDEWKRVLETIWNVGVPHVTFTGGEPTRRDDLVELVSHAEALGQVTGVLTNGQRLNDSAYLDDLAQAGLDHFLLVLNAEGSSNGLENALHSDVFTAVHLTIVDQTLEQVKNQLHRLSEKGVQAISLSSQSDSEESSAILSAMRENSAELGMDLIWDLPVPHTANNPINLEVAEPSSGGGVAWLYIEPDGDVLPEQGVDHILGNILSDTWTDIWNPGHS
jgi:MoaA/NifB/PqqE/SkfB family radical SAM enzyme